MPDTEVVVEAPNQDTNQVDGWQDKFTSPWAKESARLGERWRRQLLPLVAIGGTHGVGAVAASMGGVEAAAAVGVGWAAAGGAYGYVHQKSSRWNRVYAGIAALGSASFQVGLALAGADGIAASLLWACGCAVSVPWWVRHAEPDPDVTAELAMPGAPIPELPAGTNSKRELWNKHLAGKGKVLSNSALSEITAFQYGWKAVVELPIEHHWHEVFNARKTIESVYNLDDQRVFVESIGGRGVRTTRLTVLECDPLQKVAHWTKPGLDVEEGSFPLMVTADAELLNYQLWNPGEGASHGLVSGGTRCGKTKVLDVLLTECSMSDRIVPLICDGGGGASLPQWLDRVKLFGRNLADSKKVLRYAIDLIEARRPALIEQGGGSIEPTPERPLIVVVVDEAQEYLKADAEFRKMCEYVAQQGAKFAVGLHLATQHPSIEQLGGSSVLRGQLKTGTVVGLRVTEGTSESMISVGDPMPESLKALPAKFPDGTRTRGLGYMMTSRKIRARALLLENPRDYPVTETRLERSLTAVPVPAMDGEADAPDRPAETVFDADEAEWLVRKAMDDGISPSDITALMESTGLKMGQVRRAVSKQ